MYNEIWNKIDSSKKIAIISHIDPDGDAIGSSLALYLALKNMGKKVSIVNFTKQIDMRFSFLAGFDKIKNKLPINCDMIISCDCSNFEKTGLENKDTFLINIDHHISNTNFGDINIIKEYVSCGMLVYEILNFQIPKIGKDVLEAIYVSIAEDCNYFRAKNCDKKVFETVLELIKLGVDPYKISKNLNEGYALSTIRLRSKALNSLKLFHNGQIAYMELTDNDFNQTGAKRFQAKSFSALGLEIKNVHISLLAKQKEDGSYKVSLRSDGADLLKIAKKYNGGGHKMAAGFNIKEININDLINELGEQLL